MSGRVQGARPRRRGDPLLQGDEQLGWARACPLCPSWNESPQAKEIASEALDSRHWRVVGQALRVLQQIPLTSDDLDRLLRLLQEQASAPGPQGPWRDDWVRKRLIRAIHEHRGDLNPIQKKQALDVIGQLAAAVTHQPVRDVTKRRRLLQAIDNARQDVGL